MNGCVRVSSLSLVALGLTLLSTTEAAAQLECGYCVEYGEERLFIPGINCEPNFTGLRSEGGCRVWIRSSLLGGDGCDYDEWQEGPCPRFECGVGTAAIASPAAALRQRNIELAHAIIRMSPHITLRDDSPVISILGCTGDRPLSLEIPKEMTNRLRTLLSAAAEES